MIAKNSPTHPPVFENSISKLLTRVIDLSTDDFIFDWKKELRLQN